MTIMQEKALKLLEEQQAKVKKYSAQWAVAMQLMDICRTEPENAELIAQDLEVEAMSIKAAEKKIEEYARKNKQGNCGFCPPQEADRILREFYGLRGINLQREPAPDEPDGIVRLEDFL